MSDRPCTCHPDDNPPFPCPRKYALSECRAAAPPAVQQQADPVGKVVAAVSSENDPAMIQWTSDYRPTVGDLIYAAPPAMQPLTAQQLDALIESHCGGTEIDDGQYSAMVIFAASVERAHGIGTDHVAPPADDETAIVVTWDEAQTRIVAVTRQDCDGRIVNVIAEAPADDEAVKLLREARSYVVSDHGWDYENGGWLADRIDAYLAKVKK